MTDVEKLLHLFAQNHNSLPKISSEFFEESKNLNTEYWLSNKNLINIIQRQEIS